MVERELRLEQRQEPGADAEDRWPARSLHLCCPVSSRQHLILRVSAARWSYTTRSIEELTLCERRAATKEEILKSGTTVASLFFHNVFGAKAQKALTVFVALR